jgi:hypothetical protein
MPACLTRDMDIDDYAGKISLDPRPTRRVLELLREEFPGRVAEAGRARG